MRRLALACAALLAVASPARADEPDPIAEGRARFANGVGLYRAGDYRAALAEFRRAYAVAPSFRIQFNVAQTCVELRDWACAVKAFEAYLAEGGPQVPADQRATAESELQRLRPYVALVRIVVNVDGADVAIDDAHVGTSPLDAPVLVGAGQRRITAKKLPAQPVTTVVEVTGGDRVVEVKLEVPEAVVDANPAPPLPGPGPAPPAAEAPPKRPDHTAAWIALGTTGALTAATVTFGVLTLSAHSDLEAVANRYGASSGDLDHARSKQDTLAILTDVALGAAVVGAGVTAFLFVRAGSSTTAAVAPTGVRLVHAF